MHGPDVCKERNKQSATTYLPSQAVRCHTVCLNIPMSAPAARRPQVRISLDVRVSLTVCCSCSCTRIRIHILYQEQYSVSTATRPPPAHLLICTHSYIYLLSPCMRYDTVRDTIPYVPIACTATTVCYCYIMPSVICKHCACKAALPVTVRVRLPVHHMLVGICLIRDTP